ncbi:hypothetical protein J4E85_007445 [Alternaria conjuncta]|uniref:uncharacterized protein n=1 Tax=Alternaria conjuncta TaxID=181017 RepID=UPI00221FB863|nr:uncharacterized protein J4E85_007445 [Alternaria conjuncta]KAI4925566.1 hypothetical protein J4E85_007445 [Alternaria conjuncta]
MAPTTPLPPNRSRAIKVELYCPETGDKADNFLITPSMTHDDIIFNVERTLRLRDQEIWACDINGELLYNSDMNSFHFNNVADGEKLLIGTYDYHRIRPEPELEVVLYLDDTSGLLKRSLRLHIGPLPTILKAKGLLIQATCKVRSLEEDDDDDDDFCIENILTYMQQLGKEALRNHMSKLRRCDAPLRKNVLRLVKPYSRIASLIKDFDSANAKTLKQKYSVSASKRDIKSFWWIKDTAMKFEPGVLALMAILAEATAGNDEIASDALIDAKKARLDNTPWGSKELQEEDVREAIKALYEAADALDSVWPETQDNKKIAVKDAKKERYAKASGKGKAVKRDADLGEEAFEAAHPGTMASREMDGLAGLMDKSKLPDTMVSDDSDEEPVVKPGRLRRT